MVLGAPGPAVLTAWMSGVVVEKKNWDAAAEITLDGRRPFEFSGRGAICVVFPLQGCTTERSDCLYVLGPCTCTGGLSLADKKCVL